MRNTVRLSLAAIALAVGALLVWTSLHRERAAEPIRAAEPLEVDATTGPLDVAPLSATERSDVATAERLAPPPIETSSTAPTVDRVASAPEQMTSNVQVRFVDAAGNPWSGVRFSARDRDSAAVTSDATGRASLDVPRRGNEVSWPVAFIAVRDGCATKSILATLSAGRPTHLGDVLLAPGSRVFGRVLDANGRARANAEVGVSTVQIDVEDETAVRRLGSNSFQRTEVARSAADGGFVLDGIAVGSWRLWARGDHTRYGWSEPFELSEGRDARGVDVIVPDQLEVDLIKGVVTDPKGVPIPHAGISHSYELEHRSCSTSSQVDAQGRFEIVIDFDAPRNLIASDPEGRYSDASRLGVLPGTHDVELRLGEQFTFDVRVRGPAGEAIENCSFTLTREVRPGHTSGSSVKVESVTPGVYRLLAPSVRFSVTVEAEGFATKTTEMMDPLQPATTIDVALERAKFLRGRVVADGKPMSGARVSLRASTEDRYFAHNDFECRYEPWSKHETRTGDDGRFELAYESDGLAWVRAELAGWAPGDVGPLSPATAGEIEVILTMGGTIEGTVLLPGGVDGVGTIVGINRGDGAARTTRAGLGGRFVFEGLTPGQWQVLRRDAEIDPNTSSTTSGGMQNEIKWDCEVRVGRTTRFDLDLTQEQSPDER